eukprot:2597271-Prymnesium_polylepis.1
MESRTSACERTTPMLSPCEKLELTHSPAMPYDTRSKAYNKVVFVMEKGTSSMPWGCNIAEFAHAAQRSHGSRQRVYTRRRIHSHRNHALF